jgi:16S rRNA (uracil1498-N3)-methyltransferase
VIEPVTGLDDWLARSRPETRILLTPGAPPLARALERWDGAAPLALLVGPEGGLAPEEAESCRRAGLHLAGLGLLTLRFETAAVAALAVVMQQREDADPASLNALQGAES